VTSAEQGRAVSEQLLAERRAMSERLAEQLPPAPEPPPDVDDAPPVEREPEPDVERDTWAPVDLGPYLRGEVTRPTPGIGLQREDGLRVLYAGKDHSVIGETESGKSWWSVAHAADALKAGLRVAYVHFEESDPSDTIERLILLDVDEAVIGARFRFIGPEARARQSAVDALIAWRPDLTIYDGLNEGLALHGLKIMEPEGIAAFRYRFVRPFRSYGGAVQTADHVAKDLERQARGSFGSVHKDNGLSGSLISLENVEPFGRGRCGRSNVFVRKDRPGYLRQHGQASREPRKTFLGVLVVDDQAECPDFRCAFYAPREDVAQQAREDAGLTDHVVRVLEKADGQAAESMRRLGALLRAERVSFRNDALPDAVEDLDLAGRIERGPGRAIRLVRTAPDPTAPPL
jgi:hypothetical protein